MALGICSDSDFEAEVNRLEKGKAEPTVTISRIERGRGEGNTEVPEVLRKIIGDNALEEGNKSTAPLIEALGISSSSMTAYKNGATSTTTYNEKTGPLSDFLEGRKQNIAKRASTKLQQALTALTSDKLSEAKARELAGIAKDMSVVIRNMEPPDNGDINNQQTNFILYAPRPRAESEFPVRVLEE